MVETFNVNGPVRGLGVFMFIAALRDKERQIEQYLMRNSFTLLRDGNLPACVLLRTRPVPD